jgi:MYXO-CTERM domain-containing protein
MSIRWITLVTSLVVAASAQALPDEIKAEFTAGSGPVAAAFSDSHRLGVVVNADAATLSLLDTAQPGDGLISMGTCSDPEDVEFSGDAFVLACGSGLVARYSVSLGSFPASLSSLTDIQLSQDVDLLDLAIAGDDAWALSDDGWIFHADLATSAETTDSYYPIELAGEVGDDDDDDSASTATVDVVAGAASADGTALVVALADGWLVDVELGQEMYTATHVDTGHLDLVDVVGEGPFYLLSSDGTVMSYEAGSLAIQTLTAVTAGAGLALIDDDGADVLVVLGDGQLTYVDPTSGDGQGAVIVSSGTSAAAASGDGYLMAVDGDADLVQVLADVPWVRILDAQPDPVDLESDVTVTLTSDVAGTLTLLLGGDIDASGADLGPDVTELAAEEETDVTFSAASLADGDSVIYAFVEDDSGALGRAAIQLSTGTSTEISAPQAFAVAAGNAKVSLTWAPVTDSDTTISHYLVYFGDADFDPDSGDPGYCEDDDGELCSGFEVSSGTTVMGWITGAADDDDDDSAADDDDDDTATTDDDDDTSGDTSVSTTVDPLTNGTTYYFAVAAVDSNGDMGAFTEVLGAMPQETGGAAWLAGDPGGYGCDGCTVNGTPTGEIAALGLLLLLGAVRRIKR